MKIWFRYTHESTSFSAREPLARRRHTSYYKPQQMSAEEQNHRKNATEIKTKDSPRWTTPQSINGRTWTRLIMEICFGWTKEQQGAKAFLAAKTVNKEGRLGADIFQRFLSARVIIAECWNEKYVSGSSAGKEVRFYDKWSAFEPGFSII